jgi:hypothetical protein
MEAALAPLDIGAANAIRMVSADLSARFMEGPR